ncbi:MAG: ribose ABC transporter permease [Bacteroidetes bacterium]|nr:MAG: ribose ABC transporter permease [Bacteroidota bacterium]
MLKNIKKYNLLIVLILLIMVFGLLNPAFLKIDNLLNILSQNSIIGIVSLGMTLIIIIGGIDLSVGSIVALCSILFALSIVSGLGMLISIIVALLTGALIGLLNGITIEKGKIPPFIVTLGMMSIARGLALMLSQSKSISLGSINFNSIINSSFLGINVSSFIFILLAILLWIGLNKTYPGKYLFAIGGNRKASYFNGIKVVNYSIIIYTVCGALSAVAAVLLVGSLNAAQPQSGVLYELTAIAAVVIGGADLSGGKGSITGTFVGVLILGVINNGLSIMNVPSYYQYILIGIIIIISVSINNNFKILKNEKH